eukprot:COSAG03_NODE_1295_length_4383_cov_202.981092_4_plen_49_part_00
MCIFRVRREDHVAGMEVNLCDELAQWAGVRAAIGGGSGNGSVGGAAKL